MLVHHSGARSYLFAALEATPDLCRRLLQNLTAEEADFLLVPTRFTLREVMAHLRDWDTIFFARIQQTLNEEEPTLEEYEEGQRALDLNYAGADIAEQSHLFHDHRLQMTAFLKTLTPQQWQRSVLHPRIGPMSVEAQATLIALHDAYHLHQITQWRDAFSISQHILD